MNKYGNGRHLITIPPADLIKYWKIYHLAEHIEDHFLTFRKVNYADYQVYEVAVTLIKLSILLFYQRIFATQQFRQWINIVETLMILWMLINNFIATFQCNSLRKVWEIETLEHCFNPLSYIIDVHTTNLILNIVILALSVSAVWRLQLSLAKKISVAGIFLLSELYVKLIIIEHKLTWLICWPDSWSLLLYAWLS